MVGLAARTKVIYRTNMATSYAAGRWAQLLESGVPYIIYMRGNAREHRQEHLPWHGLVLPVGHPFWRTHATPNGWGCTCYLSGARSLDAARRRGGDPDKSLPAGWDAIDPRTGAPVGIDKGWDYAPGASVAQDLAGIVEQKAAKLPPQIAKDFKDSMKSIVQAGADPAGQSPKTPDEAIARGKDVLSALVAASPEMDAAWSVGNYAHAAPALQAAVMTELRRVRSVGQARIALVPGTRKPAATVMQGVADVMPTD